MSEVGLLNSNASITPFSSAGMISPPGSWVTFDAHLLEQVRGQAHGAVLQALQAGRVR